MHGHNQGLATHQKFTSSCSFSYDFIKLVTPATPWISSFLSLKLLKTFTVHIFETMYSSVRISYLISFLKKGVEREKEVSGGPEAIGSMVSWSVQDKTNWFLNCECSLSFSVVNVVNPNFYVSFLTSNIGAVWNIWIILNFNSIWNLDSLRVSWQRWVGNDWEIHKILSLSWVQGSILLYYMII